MSSKDSEFFLEESFEAVPELPQDPNLDHSLVQVHHETRGLTASVCEAPLMTADDFELRTHEFLAKDPNPSPLRFGLSVLAGIQVRYPEKLVGQHALDQLDGPKAIISVLHGYVSEHFNELHEHINPAEDEETIWKKAFLGFFSHHKHQLSHGTPEEHQAHQRELKIAYMTQLAHIAFHIIYYGYEPIPHTQVTPSSGTSAISMSQYGSIITGTAGKTDVRCEYHRLNIRDEDRNPNRHLKVHSSFLPHLSLHPHQRTLGPIGGYGSVSSDGSKSGFSPPLIIAVKNGRISHSETTALSTSQVSVSATLSWREVREALELARDVEYPESPDLLPEQPSQNDSQQCPEPR